MLCNNGDTVRLNSMAKQLKSGSLLRYKKRLFGKDWREDYVALYSDSTLAWFRDKERLEPDGGIVIKEAPHLIAVGQWTAKIPNRPELPPGRTNATLLAFGTKNKDRVHWFLCKDEDELNEWMTVISNTLPPPPFPQTSRNGAQPVDSSEQPGLNVYVPAPPAPSPAEYRPPPPPYSEASSQLRVDNYPPQHCRQPPPPQPPLQPPVAVMPNNTTVVVQRDVRPGGHMDGFATGMVTGAVLGSALSPPGWGWGVGLGWGGGWGGGWGYGNHGWGGGVGFYNNDADVFINNHYHINNQMVDNDVNVHNDTTFVETADTHNSFIGGFGDDTIMSHCDNDYDMGFDTGLGDTGGFDAGCDFAF